MNSQELIVSERESGELVPVAGLMDAAYDTYLAGRPEHTERAYRDRLDQFIAWRAVQPPAPFVAHLREYIAYLGSEQRKRDFGVEKVLSPRSVQAHVNTVKGLLKMAAGLDMTGRLALALPQLDMVKAPKVQGQEIGERLTDPERQLLIDAPGIDTHKGRRDTAILALLAWLGLRRSEVVGLNWSHVADVDGHKVIKDLVGKHGRTRTVKMSPALWRLLRAWGKGAGLDMSSDSPVFVRIRKGDKVQRGHRLTPEAIALLVTHYAKLAGLDKRSIKPHDLRRTAAVLARKAGASIEQVQVMLGHASPQTTSDYIGEMFNLDDHAADYGGPVIPTV